MANQLHVSSTYATNGINGTVDGEAFDLFNLNITVDSGDAIAVETDDTPSDNAQNLVTSDVVGATATLSATASNEDGSRNFKATADVELVAEDVPVGAFELNFVEIV